MTLAAVKDHVERSGLCIRSAFHVEDDDEVPVPAATLILLGWVGSASWKAFAASAEATDGRGDPLDRWSRRVIDDIARTLCASALYPFAGPPWLPFQRWAQRGGRVFVSPLGILIHPDWGLWHSYRGALAFPERLGLPTAAPRANPCDTCVEKPCLARCPVSAFSRDGYDVSRCRAHVSGSAGAACMETGCLARNACPIGAEHRYTPTHAAFHMHAFRGDGRLPDSPAGRAR